MKNKCIKCEDEKKIYKDNLCKVCYENRRDAKLFKRFLVGFFVFSLFITIGIEYWVSIKSFMDLSVELISSITPDFVKTFLITSIILIMPCSLIFVLGMYVFYQTNHYEDSL